MLYLILRKEQFEDLPIGIVSQFMKFQTKIIFKDFIFVAFYGNYLDCQNILINFNLEALCLYPFISDDLKNKLYNCETIETEEKYLDSSLFEILIADYLEIYPKFSRNFKSVLPSVATKDDLFINIQYINNYLQSHKLLLKEINLKPTLQDLFVNAWNKTIEQEAVSEFITWKEIKNINEDFFELVIAEFLIEARRYYPEKSIKSFLVKEFKIEQ